VTSELTEVLKTSAKWLLAQQDPSSGGWGQNPGDDVSSLNTGEAVLAILDSGAGIEPGHLNLVKAKNFLIRTQSSDEACLGAWTRTVDRGAAELPDVLRTAVVLRALVRLGVSATDSVVERALNWLRVQRKSDGGWGNVGDLQSRMLQTCHALMALIAVAAARDEATAGNRAVFDVLILPARDWLIKNLQTTGAFGSPGPLQAAHTILAVAILQRLQKGGFEVVPDHERRALRWLADNPDKTMDLVEEDVILDASVPRHNYPFLYMTDALLVGILYSAKDRPSGIEQLAEEALMRVKVRQDGRGGFYGNRVFSWSTAKCVSALSSAADERADFPVSIASPEKAGRGASLAIIIAAAVLWACALVLAAVEKFTPVTAIFGLSLLFILLVTLRVISERTFAKVAGLGITNLTPP
jgi:Squalene-hopene cyclase C-terminal domain/Prenyltransferase and squalene oxidase repeat